MNLTAKQFDLGNARACVAVARTAYDTYTIHNEGTDTYCWIWEEKDCITIAFRGSVSIRNWITDAEFERTILVSAVDGTCSKVHLTCDLLIPVKSVVSAVDGTCSKVHRGFERALNSIWEKLYAALGGCAVFNVQNCKPIFVTGHSLGGALAILAALSLDRNGFQVAQVYTFGQPRVGNGDFKKRYDAALGDKTFRVVYEEDIVARIPHLPDWGDLYRHVGTEIFQPATTGGRVVNPSLWFLLKSDLWGIYRAFIIKHFAGAAEPMDDHHISNYVAALQSND